MPIGTAAALGISLGAAALGGAAGAMGKNSNTNYTSNVNLGPASALENSLGGTSSSSGFLGQNFNDLSNMVNAGPGQKDVTNSYNATNDFAGMLKAYSEQGGNLPTAGDISSANSLASSLFQPQQVALQQSFTDQGIAADRQAALLGRSVNDPILQAKLRTEQMRQSNMLSANQGAFANQFALQQPGQRLGYAEQRTNVLGGLATQAMANRQALSSLGSNLLNNDRNWRLSTASRSGTQDTTSGGGLGGAISGGLAGLGTGLGVAGMFMGSGGTNTPGLSGMNYNQSPSQFFGLNTSAAQPTGLGYTPVSTSGMNSIFNPNSAMGRSYTPFSGM